MSIGTASRKQRAMRWVWLVAAMALLAVVFAAITVWGASDSYANAVGRKNAQACDNCDAVIKGKAPQGQDYDDAAGAYVGDKYNYEKLLDGAVYRGGNSRSQLQGVAATLDNNPDDFAAVLPYGTVYIDASKINWDDPNGFLIDIPANETRFMWVAASDTAAEGVRDKANHVPTRKPLGANKSAITQVASPDDLQIAYVGPLNGYLNNINDAATQAPDDANKNIFTPVAGADYLYQITYYDVATLPDGSKGDLVMTVTRAEFETSYDTNGPAVVGMMHPNEMKLAVSYQLDGEYLLKEYGGPVGGVDEFTYTNTNNKTAKAVAGTADVRGATGMEVDFGFKVVDKQGNAVDGSILYAAYDLDFRNFQELWGRSLDGPNRNKFNESITINSGALSYAVTPKYNPLAKDPAPNTTETGWAPVGPDETEVDSPLKIFGEGGTTANGVTFTNDRVSKVRNANGTFTDSQGKVNVAHQGVGSETKHINPSAKTSHPWVTGIDRTTGQLTTESNNTRNAMQAYAGKILGKAQANVTQNELMETLGYTTERNDQGTYDSGFAVLLSSKGSNLTWSASAMNGNNAVATGLFKTTLFTAVEVTHGTGGGIYFETYNLTDQCKVTRGEGSVTMGKGVDAVATVVPEDGHRVKTIMVGEAGLANPVTYTVADLTFTQDGEGRWLYTDTANNVIIEDNKDGTYDVTFPSMDEPRHVHVDFTADYYFYKVWKGDEEPTSLDMTTTPFAFVFKDVKIGNDLYTIDGNTFTAPDGTSYELKDNAFTVGEGAGAITYFLEGNSLVTYTTDAQTGTRTKDQTYDIRLDYVKNGDPVSFKVTKADADSATETHVATDTEEIGGQSYTVWKISYPADGCTTESGQTWPALPIETEPTAHNINHVERNYWFVTEDAAPGWAVVSYDNSKAETAGKIDDATARQEVYKVDKSGDLSAWAKASTKDYAQAVEKVRAADNNDHAYLSVFNSNDNDSYSWGGRIVNVPALVVNAEKSWDDIDNTFDLRKDVWFHIDATIESSAATTTIKDVLPPQKLASDATKLTFTWGDQKEYAVDYPGFENIKIVANTSEIPVRGYVQDATNSRKYTPLDATMPTYYVNELVQEDGLGNKITYTLRETDKDGTEADQEDVAKFLEGYTTKIDELKKDEKSVKVNDVDVPSYTGTITNTLERVNFTLVKVWDTPKSAAEVAALEDTFKNAVTVVAGETEVVKNGEDVYKYADPSATKVFAWPKATVSEDGKTYTYVWEGLPKYLDGAVAKYSATEVGLTGFEGPIYTNTEDAEETTKAYDKGTITNKQTPPTPTNDETWGVKGETQTGTPSFEKGTADIEKVQLIDPATGKPTDAESVDALDENGKKIGTYTLNEDGTVTFKPEPDYVGTPQPAKLMATDKNGLTATAEYQPHVYEATPLVSKDGQYDPADQDGKTLKTQQVNGKAAFGGLPKPVEKVTLVDDQGNEVNEINVPGEGTYVLDPETGIITFTPEEGFTGTATGVTLRGTDGDGNSADSRYTPIVVPNKQTETLTREIEYRYIDDEGNEVTEMVTETYEFTRVGSYNPTKDDDPTGYNNDPADKDDQSTIDYPAWTPQSPKTPQSPDKSADGWTVRNEPDDLVGLTPDNAAEWGFVDDGTGNLVKSETVYYDPAPPVGTPKETYGLVGQPQKTDGKALFKPTTTTTKTGEPNKIEKIQLIDPDTGNPADKVPAYDVNGKPCGEYSVDDKGIVTFKPNPDYPGVPEVKPATLIATDSNGLTATTTYQPHTLTGADTFTYTRTVDYRYDNGDPVLDENGKPLKVEQTVSFSRDPELDADGNVIVDEQGNVKWKPWVPESNSIDDVVSPELPDGWYTGQDVVDGADGITPSNATSKMPDVTVIYHKPPTADEKKTFGGKGQTQKGTPPFTKGSGELKEFTLLDPKTGEPTDKIEVPGVGSYTLDPKTGEVTFVPEPDFVGVAPKVAVRGTDEHGGTANGYYTPTVLDSEQTKEVTRTIEYLYDDGTPVMEEVDDPDNPGKTKEVPKVRTQTLTFERTGTVDPDKGTITYPAWTPQNYTEVPSDPIEGYTPDKPTVPATSTTPPDGDKHEKVVYTKQVFTVTFVDGDHGKSDGEGNEGNKPYGSTPKGGNGITPDEGYEFTGYYTYVITKPDGTTETGRTNDPTSVTVTGNIVFTPEYKALPWVTYIDPATGRVIKEKTNFNNDGTEPPAPANPTRDGFVFDGWDRTVDENGNVTYTAKWKPAPVPGKTYWVTYVDPDGTTVYLEKTTQNEGEDEPAAPPEPTKEGFVFNGWDRSVDADGNVTYTAKWTPASPSAGEDLPWVTYIDPATGRVIKQQTSFNNDGTEPPAPANPTRDGYVFDGWDRSVDANGNVTYTARWKPVGTSEDPKPVKTVDSASSKIISRTHTVTYTITQKVSDDATSLVITDTLEPVLEFVSGAGDVQVTCNGQPVEAKVTIEGQTLRVEIANAEALRGQTVSVVFQVKVKDGADLTPYVKNGIAVIGNVAVTEFNGDPKRTVTSKEVTIKVATGSGTTTTTTTTPKGTTTTTTTSKTGDSAPIVLLAILVLAGAGSAAFAFRRRSQAVAATVHERRTPVERGRHAR